MSSYVRVRAFDRRVIEHKLMGMPGKRRTVKNT